MASGERVVIAAATRTPIGAFGGALSSLSGAQLGSIAIKGALERAGLSPDAVDEVYMGNVIAANAGQAPQKQASLFAGIPNTVPCTGVNKVCASGMKAVMLAAQSISLGHNQVVVAGGFESMSNIPYYLPKARTGYKLGHGEVVDGIVKDGLWDVYNDQHMGNCGEACAEEFGFTREDQDAYAIESYKRSKAAHEAGLFSSEIVPVTVSSRGKDTVVTDDEEYHRINLDKVGTLRAAFKKDGTVTAANASSINDGASALVLMSESRAVAAGVTPLAYIRGYADAAQDPVKFTTAPALAVPIALQRAGIAAEEVEYHEINEAFSVVVLANMRLLGLSHDRVNVNGGAVSLGHPIGCSGARIITTLTHLLHNKKASIGCASICNGGGGASAIVIERA
eukprot:TRINITY_DN391_c0_g2_i1.p1 TRINITY_DN391_c0_g2~~TRINITY_DN391_c0_g2_i1.p1  ORF type:complete len:447 (+),score=161.44 TRINITY_DN391_c0_g2_i1:159-1343(+)